MEDAYTSRLDFSGRRSPQDDRCAEVVGPDVVVHIVQADTETDLGRKMDDGMAAFHRCFDPLQVGDVVAVRRAPGRTP